MKFLNRYKSFNEDVKEDSEGPVRSERLLTQAQKEWKDDSGIERGESLPSMLFTDVEGSSEMWSNDPVTMMQQLKGHHQLVDRISKKWGGWIVKTIGDAFMIYFEPTKDSLERAVKCAKDIIQSESTYNLRAGVCEGPMQEDTFTLQKVRLKDFFGNSVNVASRMESKVAGKSGYVAFSSIEPISKNRLQNLKSIGEVEEVNLKNIELKGAKTEAAYKIKVK